MASEKNASNGKILSSEFYILRISAPKAITHGILNQKPISNFNTVFNMIFCSTKNIVHVVELQNLHVKILNLV